MGRMPISASAAFDVFLIYSNLLLEDNNHFEKVTAYLRVMFRLVSCAVLSNDSNENKVAAVAGRSRLLHYIFCTRSGCQTYLNPISAHSSHSKAIFGIKHGVVTLPIRLSTDILLLVYLLKLKTFTISGK